MRRTGVGAPRAVAQGARRPDRGTVEVAKASGYLDEVLVDFLSDRIEAAERDGLVALVIQLNSRGATVSDERIVELAPRCGARPCRSPSGSVRATPRPAARPRSWWGSPAPEGSGPRRPGSGGPARRSCLPSSSGRSGATRPSGWRSGNVHGGDDDAEALKELGLVERAGAGGLRGPARGRGRAGRWRSDRRGRGRVAGRSAGAERDGPIHVADARRAADAHGGQPLRRLPAAGHRARPDRVRAVHRRHRHRRGGRRDVAWPSPATAWLRCRSAGGRSG